MADSESSTLSTSYVQGNEIVKADDFNYGFESLVNNISRFAETVFETDKDFIIGGNVSIYNELNVQVAPIFGICNSTRTPFVMVDKSDPIAVTPGTTNRIDILEVKGEWVTFDNQQRGFNDLDNNVITYQNVDTKRRVKLTYVVKMGSEGAAPEKDEGYVKIAEIHYTANATELSESDIYNITSDVATEENEEWTTEKDATYNIGHISDVNERFRVEHNADGSHKDQIIKSNNIDFGNGSTQVDGSKIPVGGSSQSVGYSTVSATDTLDTVTSTLAGEINKSIYQDIISEALEDDSYIKITAPSKSDNISLYTNAGEKIDLTANVISGVVTWTKAVGNSEVITKLLLDSSNNLYVKLIAGGTFSLKSQNNQKYTFENVGTEEPSSLTELAIMTLERDTTVTKDSINLITSGAVYDSDKIISDALEVQKERIDEIMSTSGDSTTYSNNVLSRYDYVTGIVDVATTEEITLYGEQIIDNVNVSAGFIVLVKNQSDNKGNGIYVASTTNWVRKQTDISFDYSTFDKLKHKMFIIGQGSVNVDKVFYTPTESLEGTLTDESVIPFSEYKKLNTQQLEDSSVSFEKIGCTESSLSASTTKIPSSKAVNDALTNFPPVGSVIAFAGATAPSGWLMCDGSEVSQTTYATLYAIIGTTYGTASSGMFKLPNLCECSIVGVGKNNDYSITTHNVLTLGTFQDDQYASHTHTVTDPGHGHNVEYTGPASSGEDYLKICARYADSWTTASGLLKSAKTGITIASSGKTSGGTHGKQLGMNYIIRY